MQEKSRYKVACNGLIFFVLCFVDQPGLEPGTSRLWGSKFHPIKLQYVNVLIISLEVYQSTISQQIPNTILNITKQQTLNRRSPWTKKGSISLEMSLLVCGPAWAWTRDLQIMRTIKWYSTIVHFININWISSSYKFYYFL